MTSLGVWIDDHWIKVIKPNYLDSLKSLGFSTISIMVNSLRPGWIPEWSQRNIRKVSEMAIERDIEVVLTTWPVPYEPTIDVMASYMRDALSYGAAGWEVDLEGNWRRRAVRGDWTLEEASAYLVNTMRDIAHPLDVRLEVTTYPYHRENSQMALISPHVDRVTPQAYSTRYSQGVTIELTDVMGPKYAQKMTLERSKSIPGIKSGDISLNAGLAAWSQKWPRMSEIEAMSMAYQEALRFEPLEIRYWSSKWIIGHRATGYSQNFFEKRINQC